jgi:DNA-binding transcriptional MocR family regulator
MGRLQREIDPERVAVVVLQMIVSHAGRPCPTRRQIMQWTGLQQRRVWGFLDALAARGLIEIEVRGGPPGHTRRMRMRGGAWTGWTVRRISAGVPKTASSRWPDGGGPEPRPEEET